MAKSTMMLLSAILLFPFLLSNTSADEDPVEYEPATTDAAEPTPTTVTVSDVRVNIEGKTVKCEFVLVFLFDRIDIRSSSMNCNKGVRGKSGPVEFTSREGYKFSGVIKPPRKIISMTGGDIFGGFMANIRTNDSKPIEIGGCGGYGGTEVFGTRGYTEIGIDLWTEGVVEYAFMSDGSDELKDFAFDVDAKIGFNKAELGNIMKAMKRIEESTCIRFHRIEPIPGKKWLLLMRTGRVEKTERTATTSTEDICYAEYLNENLKDKTYGDLGKVFDIDWNAPQHCFGGAFTLGLGMRRTISYMIASMTRIDDSEGTIGLFTHELLHNLGVGHTQKRPDRDNYITVNRANIKPRSYSQFDKCKEGECETYGTPYDCSSIMHYTDWMFKIDGVGVGPTMTPKNAETCSLGDYGIRLTDNDVTLLRKMYCDQKHKNLVTSHPLWGILDYPNDNNIESHIRVEEGFLIEIRFTDFKLEPKGSSPNCYDWVRIEDGDGTELLEKTCGEAMPMTAIRSKTNKATIFFVTDSTVTEKGYRAEWKKVSPEIPVDGQWSNWGAWGSCGNNQDGKSTCTQSRSRFCSNPVPSNGGLDCQGSADASQDCSPHWLITVDDNNHPQCVIHGGWSAWSTSSVCNRECKTTKTRTCTSPPPFNSKACEGESSLTSSCTGGECNSGDSGEVTSPGYPNNYGNNINHETSTIEVSENSQVELTFVDFDVEFQSNCDYDFVEVLDSDGSQLLKHCGYSLPVPDKITSTGNSLKVIFKSDVSQTYKGFRATWKKVSTVGGSIKSPNFPQHYPPESNEEWVLQAPRGYKIKLTLLDFDIEHGNPVGTCNFDYLEVQDGTSVRYCNHFPPSEPIVSSGRILTVRFHSDDTVQHTGFHATWTAVPA